MTSEGAQALARRIDRAAEGPQVAPAEKVVAALNQRLKARPEVHAALGGDWLGHPIHPPLTDLPIGFWTSAMVLDLGGRRMRPAADLMVALGLLTAAPTAAAGLVDWGYLPPAAKRVGAVHAAVNATAGSLYLASLLARRRGHRLVGVALGFAGGAVASGGGYLGGRLAFETSTVGEEHRSPTADQPDPTEDGIVDQQGAVLAEMGADGGPE
jgi:uncharacterized membrane protein